MAGADVFADVSISGGPRLTAATRDYFDAGVNAAESAASGLSTCDPHGGLHSVGLGAAITWAATDRLETIAYAE